MNGTERQGRRPRLFLALRSLRQLIADPNDTPRVFEIIRALGGPSLRRGLRRFRATAVGRRVLRGKRDLIEALRDRDALSALPAGSLGRRYRDFVASEEISADGLAEASATDQVRFDDADLKRYAERMRDQHDLWHVVADYGRDPFGEACLLAFTYAQTRNRGLGLIVLAGVWRLGRTLGPRSWRALWEGYRHGRHASWLPMQDWEALLPLPLDEVRRLLAVPPPTAYQAVRATIPAAATA